MSRGGHHNASALKHPTRKAVSDVAVLDVEVLHSCGCKCSWLSSSHWRTKLAAQSFALTEGNAVEDVNGADRCFAIQSLCYSGVAQLCLAPWHCQLQVLEPSAMTRSQVKCSAKLQVTSLPWTQTARLLLRCKMSPRWLDW